MSETSAYPQSYTAELAYESNRHRERTTLRWTMLNLFPNSRIWHRLLGFLSFGFGLGVSGFLIAGSIALVPSMIFSKLMGWPSAFNRPRLEDTAVVQKNTSCTEVGSLTALKTFAARSQMTLQRSGGPDSIAPLLIQHVSLVGPNIPGRYYYTHIYLLLCRCHYYLTGRIFVDQLTEFCLKKLTKLGEIASLQARTCWFDDVVDAFALANEGKEFNVVILGAGFDTRCYRLNSIMHKSHVHLFEVDAPGTQRIKTKALKDTGIQCDYVNFVSCNFEHEEWMDSLQKQSTFDRDLPSIIVWEGVTMYLELDVIKSTISKIASCGAGSSIAFDYMFHSSINDAARKSADRVGEPWKSTIDYDEIGNIVADCQKLVDGKAKLKVIDHLQKDEMKSRYLAMYNDGSYIGYLEDFGAFCLMGI